MQEHIFPDFSFFPWPLMNSLTIPGFLGEWPPWLDLMLNYPSIGCCKKILICFIYLLKSLIIIYHFYTQQFHKIMQLNHAHCRQASKKSYKLYNSKHITGKHCNKINKKLCCCRGTAWYVLSVVTTKVTFSGTHWYSCHSIGHTRFSISHPLYLFEILSFIAQNFKRSCDNDHAH